MKIKTNIGQVLGGTPADKLKYNTSIINVLSDKNILAWIMKYSIDVYKDCSVEEIKSYIEGKPEVHKKKVLPGNSQDKIVGNSEKELIFDEGESYFDIRFYAFTPNGEYAKLIINVEAQNDYDMGYDIVTRGIFYCARMISSQYGTEFDKSNYQNIHKVYSIWLCPMVPKEVEYTITSYKMTKSNIYGVIPDGEYYDLLEVVIVCLGKEANKSNGTKLHQLMSTLLSTTIKLEQKKDILKEEFQIETTKEFDERVRFMCNLADGIEAKAKLEELISLVNEGLLDKEVAAKRVGMSLEEFEELLNINSD